MYPCKDTEAYSVSMHARILFLFYLEELLFIAGPVKMPASSVIKTCNN